MLTHLIEGNFQSGLALARLLAVSLTFVILAARLPTWFDRLLLVAA
ncbi:MAG TPA: hypothetical protein V6D03_10670 [Candidatus Caenarcaniphilales bacterium]